MKLGQVPRCLIALALAGCARSASIEPTKRRVIEPPLPVVPASTSAQPPREEGASVGGGGLESGETPHHDGPLARFHDALRDLDAGRRRSHVRIMWLGDSHGQADFWTGGVRTALQRRFGHAGPGFMHVGMPNYRHDSVLIDRKGRWRMRPKGPARTDRWGDGAFGVGGVLSGPYAGDQTVSLELRDSSLAARTVRWDLCFKLDAAIDRIEVEFGDERIALDGSRGGVGALEHLERTTRGRHRLLVRVTRGRPLFCGAHAETDAAASPPGVLVDNLGINGARYATALAWDEAAWISEVRRHPPDLFVFEYGANEAGDATPHPERYRAHAVELIARARKAVPDASCLVLAPPDRVDRTRRMPEIVEALRGAAEASGCGFWDTFAAMGGVGSMATWRESKKGAPD
ncbi:MAG: hypothetical protein FJ096_20285, partial [Deltaproteobacteria bacterium]|nr:hypothetical protein [Deltaproteobacteria bacterium]